MPTFITIGRRLVQPEHVAFIEHYDAGANPSFQTSRTFLSRVMLLNRDSILIEESLPAFAEANGFRILPHDRVAINPLVRFQVEQFLPTEGFTPSKAYESRLLWRDFDGNQQSKLLLSEPAAVFAIISGEAKPEQDAKPAPRNAPRRRPRQARPRGLQAS